MRSSSFFEAINLADFFTVFRFFNLFFVDFSVFVCRASESKDSLKEVLRYENFWGSWDFTSLSKDASKDILRFEIFWGSLVLGEVFYV